MQILIDRRSKERTLKWIKKCTFAVLKMTFLQSGRMLTDQAGRKYKFPLNVTFASKLLSTFARKAAQSLEVLE